MSSTVLPYQGPSEATAIPSFAHMFDKIPALPPGILNRELALVSTDSEVGG